MGGTLKAPLTAGRRTRHPRPLPLQARHFAKWQFVYGYRNIEEALKRVKPSAPKASPTVFDMLGEAAMTLPTRTVTGWARAIDRLADEASGGLNHRGLSNSSALKPK
jgi:hypothetical protein